MRFCLSLTLFFSLFLVSGCSRPLPPRDTLRVGISTEVSSLDPQLCQSIAEVRVLSAIYEGLVLPFPADSPQGMNAASPISPGVAQRWEVSADGLEYTFYLRREAKWSNGAAVNAEDFVQSWKRAMSPELAAPNA